jgi:hypothetical protein
MKQQKHANEDDDVTRASAIQRIADKIPACSNFHHAQYALHNSKPYRIYNIYMPVTRGQKRDAEMEAALKLFFSSPRFAVAGASSDPSKYGHKSTLTSTLSCTILHHR